MPRLIVFDNTASVGSACAKRPSGEKRAAKRESAEELVKREFGADGPNMAWFADITYVKTRQGWLYLVLGYMGSAKFEEANWPEGEGRPKAS